MYHRKENDDVTVPVIVALDSSTTACKAVVFNLSGETVCESRRYLAMRSPQPGWYEQDADDWREAAAGALAAVAEQLSDEHEPIAIGLTHQRETFVCVDADMRPVRPAILWLDNRAEEQVTRLGSAERHQATGKPPSTVPSFYKLAWLAEHEPETLRRTHLVLDVHAYLAWWLVGRPVSSWASADSTGLLDLATREWSAPLASACGVRLAQLPELAAPGTAIGGLQPDVARGTRLPPGLPVIAGAGDGQCAGLGVGGLAAGTAYLNLGTSFSLGTFVPAGRTYPGLRTILSGVPDTTAVETLQLCGGMALTWLQRTILDADLEEQAQAVPAGANGLLFLPYLAGRESPDPQRGMRAAFLGLEVRHHKAGLMRAVVEGLAYDQRDCLNHLRAQVGTEIERIVLTGGYAQSRLVTSVFANVLGVPVALAPERESTALGAAIIAAAGSDRTPYESVRAAAEAMTRPAETILIDAVDVKVYESGYLLRAEVLGHYEKATAALAALRRLG